MEVIIREAQNHDIPDLLKLNNELNGVGLSTVESMKESLENNKNEIIFVAVCDNEVAGFICGQLYSSICYSNSKEGEITELMIDENYRRKGIATMLINRMELEFTKNNVLEITVKTGIKNFNAQKLYEKCGYEHKRKAYLKNIFPCT